MHSAYSMTKKSCLIVHVSRYEKMDQTSCTYDMCKKQLPILYSKLLYKMGHYFLDI